MKFSVDFSPIVNEAKSLLETKCPTASLRTRLIEQAVGGVAGAGKALLTAGCFSEHPGQTESNIPVHLLTGWAS